MEPGEALVTTGQFEPSSAKTRSAPESQETDVQPEQNMTSPKEASAKLKSAQDIIGKHLDQGFFGKEGEDKYTKAQTALSYEGTGGASTQEASLQIQAMIDGVRELTEKDPQDQELNS